jgi:tRNA A-37 threonylcarbamoyl transferase component Bud32
MKVVLTVLDGRHSGKKFVFDRHDQFIVGRAKFAHFRPDNRDLHFSRAHFLIEVNPPACRLLDLGSTNGTYVNDEPVRMLDLANGDIVEAGDTRLKVGIEDEIVFAGETWTEAFPGDVSTNSSTSAIPEYATRDRARLLNPQLATPSDAEFPVVKGGMISLAPFPQIQGFAIDAVVGQGAVGTVYRAQRQKDGAEVAIKVVRVNGSVDNRVYARFVREARILVQLNHTSIVRCHHVGEEAGLLYLVMDYVAGCDAKQLVQSHESPLPYDRVWRIVQPVLDGLEFAHHKGFVHRDIKPSNVLVFSTPQGEASKLADFGLARVYRDSPLSGLTLTGDICGTPAFMAPEQITNARGAGPAADQYSAACLVYYLLTKSHIHDFTVNVQATLQKILFSRPIPLAERRPGASAALEGVLRKAMSHEPSDRFPGIAAFSTSLRAAILGC